MGKLSEQFKKLSEKLKKMSKTKKIALSIAVAGAIIAIIVFIFTTSSTKYSVLFSNMDPNDAQTVISELNSKKVSMKVQGNTILVPSSQVDELRLELASSANGSSKGWQLFDNTSQFGMTDSQMQVTYQRALEGELENTIKSFPQVDTSKVNLVLPEDSVFVKDSTNATASVALKLKPGKSLNKDQVKAIVALLSGSVKNLPQANIQIVDDKMTLLTQGLFDSSNNSTEDASLTSDEQQKKQELQANTEKALEDKVTALLSPIYKDKVKVKVNADLNFDAIKNQTTAYTGPGVVVSEHKVTSSGANTNGSTNSTSQSPTDNSMANTTPSSNSNSNSNSSDDTVNYDVNKSDTTTVKSPGDVKKLTVSIMVDGNIDAATKSTIEQTAMAAVGYDQTRGDLVSVQSLTFDNTDSKNAQKAVQNMNAQLAKQNQMRTYIMSGIGAAALLLLIALIVIILKKKKNKEEEILEETQIIPPVKSIDEVIDDNVEPKTDIEKKTKKELNLGLDVVNEQMQLEDEIKKYAQKKPDQVVEIIKSWLSEDER